MLSAKRWSCYPENGVLAACVKHMFFPNIGVSVVRFGAPLASSPRARPLSWGAAGWTSPTPGLDSRFLSSLSFSRTSPFPALIFEVKERHFVKASRGSA